MKYKLIILDGQHQGMVIDSMDAPPEYKITIMRTITIDSGKINPIPEDDYITYKRTFIAEDRRTILYSMDGDSFESITGRRDWVVSSDKYYRKLEPLYFNEVIKDVRSKN